MIDKQDELVAIVEGRPSYEEKMDKLRGDIENQYSQESEAEYED